MTLKIKPKLKLLEFPSVTWLPDAQVDPEGA